MTTKEYNKTWREFGVESGRFKISNTGRMYPVGMPKCSYDEEKGIKYLETGRFRWIAETFRLWGEYKKEIKKT